MVFVSAVPWSTASPAQATSGFLTEELAGRRLSAINIRHHFAGSRLARRLTTGTMRSRRPVATQNLLIAFGWVNRYESSGDPGSFV